MYEKVEPESNKDDFLQAIRGICIICVVLIHCTLGMEFKKSVSLSFNYDYWLIFRQFINFPVACFIFISGYFTNLSLASNNRWQFISKRGKRILLPYITWTLFYLIIKIILGTEMTFKTIAYYILTGGASAPLYFLVVLMQLIVLTPILATYMNKKWFNICCSVVTPLYLVAMYFYNFSINGQMPLYNVFFPVWFIFYFMGLHARRKKSSVLLDFRGNKLLSSMFLVLFALLLSCLECYLLLVLDQTEGFATSQIKITSFIYAAAVINLFFTIKQYDTKVNPILVKLGDNSFGIFFIHCFYLMFINKALSYLPYLNNFLIVNQLIQVIFAISLSYITIELSRKILGKKISRVMLGF